MLRVGLTGGLGSGKSAVALVWADAGVPVLQADALGRALMEPGQPVHQAIVDAFGASVVGVRGELDRAALARAAFEDGGLLRLNAIVHPAVITEQQRRLDGLEASGEHDLAVVESALMFEASGRPLDDANNVPGMGTVPGWRERFDRIVLVTAPEAERVERFVRRAGGSAAGAEEQARLAEDARRRMAAQLPDAWKRERSDVVIENNRTLVLLRREALTVLRALRQEAQACRRPAAGS